MKPFLACNTSNKENYYDKRTTKKKRNYNDKPKIEIHKWEFSFHHESLSLNKFQLFCWQKIRYSFRFSLFFLPLIWAPISSITKKRIIDFFKYYCKKNENKQLISCTIWSDLFLCFVLNDNRHPFNRLSSILNSQ